MLKNNFQGEKLGIPRDATIHIEIELINIEEKTGRFWTIDTDNDENLSIEEFTNFLKENPKSKIKKENLDEFIQDNFKKIDTDMDGIVTIKEFEKVRDEL